jgi:hypothetical protein
MAAALVTFHIQADSIRCLRSKLWTSADTPVAPSLKMNPVAAQYPPNLVTRDIAQPFGQQFPRPSAITRRRLLIEHGQNESLRILFLNRLGSRSRSVAQYLQATTCKASAPFPPPCRAHINLTSDQVPASAGRGGKDDSCPQNQALLGFRAPNPRFEGPADFFG